MRRIAVIWQSFLAVAGMILTAVLAILCLRYRVFISLDYAERVEIRDNGIGTVCAVLLFLLVLVLLPKLPQKLTAGRLYLFFSVIWLLAGVVLIFVCAGSELRADQERVWYYAQQFNAGDYTGLDPRKYLGWYPYQLGMVTFERILSLVRPTARMVFLVNLLMALGINGFLLKGTDLMTGGDQRILRLTVVLSFAFLPQFFYILFAYGQIPGLFFLSAAGVLLILRFKRGIGPALIGCILCCAVAVLLKPNYLIGIVAFCLTLGVYSLRERRAGLFLALIALILSVPLGTMLLNKYYEAAAGKTVPDGIPTLCVVAMGLQEGDPGSGAAAGWNNNWDVDTFTENGYDPAVASAISREYISGRLDEFAADPAMAADFFYTKIRSTWCDPMYGSIWIGPWPDGPDGQSLRPEFLRQLYRGAGIYPVLAAWMNGLSVLLFAGAAVYLAGCLRRQEAADMPLRLLPCLWFLGAFFYHLVSETKSQYVYMYVYMMLPYLACELAQLDRIGAIAKRRNGK